MNPPVYRWNHLRVCTLRLSLLWGIGPFTIFFPNLYSSDSSKGSKTWGPHSGCSRIETRLSISLSYWGFWSCFLNQLGIAAPLVAGMAQCRGLAHLVLPGRDLALLATSCGPIVGISTVQALGVSPLFVSMPFAFSRYCLDDQPGPCQASLQPQPCLLLLKPVQLILTHSPTHSSSGPTACMPKSSG